MTYVIDKLKAKKTNNDLEQEITKNQKKGNLSVHFGKLKRNIDGLKFQREVRENES